MEQQLGLSLFDRGTTRKPKLTQQGEAVVSEARAVAHSIETWIGGELAGGLYCVALGRAVFGESMFTRAPDASKIALAALVAVCRAVGIAFIDCQQNTDHLASLGAREIDRADFVAGVARNIDMPAPLWQFEPVYWRQLLPREPA